MRNIRDELKMLEELDAPEVDVVEEASVPEKAPDEEVTQVEEQEDLVAVQEPDVDVPEISEPEEPSVEATEPVEPPATEVQQEDVPELEMPEVETPQEQAGEPVIVVEASGGSPPPESEDERVEMTDIPDVNVPVEEHSAIPAMSEIRQDFPAITEESPPDVELPEPELPETGQQDAADPVGLVEQKILEPTQASSEPLGEYSTYDSLSMRQMMQENEAGRNLASSLADKLQPQFAQLEQELEYYVTDAMEQQALLMSLMRRV